MSVKEIQDALERAYHEIGRAFANVGAGRYLSAEFDAGRALDLIQRAYDALSKIQD